MHVTTSRMARLKMLCVPRKKFTLITFYVAKDWVYTTIGQVTALPVIGNCGNYVRIWVDLGGGLVSELSALKGVCRGFRVVASGKRTREGPGGFAGAFVLLL